MKEVSNSRRCLWIVSELYAPELTSTGYFITEIAERLAARGVPVRAVCSQPTYAAHGTSAPRRELRGGVDVTRTRGPSLAKDRVAGKVANMLAFCAGEWRALWRDVGPGDVILAVTNPPLAPYVAARAARRRGARFVLLVHDMFPETLAVTGFIPSTSAVFRTLDAASRRLLGAADLVIAIGRDMQRRLLAKGARNVAMIPNWADLKEVVPVAPPPLGPGEPFIVQYAGNLGRTHDLGLLLDAAAATAGIARWDFIGSGAQRPAVDAGVTARGLHNVNVADYRPRAERSASLGACHAAVVAFRAGMAGISVPSRMYNVMASARPVLAVCDPDSELAMVVTEHGVGWVVSPGDRDGLAAAVREAATAPDSCRAMGARARAVVERLYARDVVLDQYADAIQSLLSD